MSEIGFSSIKSISYVKIYDNGNACEIKPYQNELENCRKEDMESTMKSVTEIRRNLENLKIEVSKSCVKDERDADYFRRKMLDVESRIGDLKEAIREELMLLMRDETNLSRDLQSLEKRIEDWSKPLNSKLFKPIKQSSYRTRNGDSATVEFQKFLSATGGHYGGWEEQDHLVFLRERRKYKGKPKFLSVVHSLIPDLSYDEVVEHETWYLEYESLKNSQREAIQKWRNEKETSQLEKAVGDPEKDGRKEGNPRKKLMHQRNIAERIKEWKKQQLLRKEEEEERQRKEEQRLREERMKKKEIERNKKALVSQYKAEKARKLQAEILCQEEDKPQTGNFKLKNSILLKAFRLQDLKFIEKKQAMRLQSEWKAREREERLNPRLESMLERDPQRIFQPTFIWTEHCKPIEKKDKLIPVFDLKSIPKLAVPEWRRELK